MTTALTSISGSSNPVAVAERLPGRHLHLRGNSELPKSPYFIDAWTQTADPPATHDNGLDAFLDAGGQLELCDATTHPRQWCRAKLFDHLMVPEFAARELEQSITQATFEDCLRPGVWLAIARRDDQPVAVAVLLPCSLQRSELATRAPTSRDRFLLAAENDELRSLLLTALPHMVAEHGVQWLRARRRPWMVTEELAAWTCELGLVSELVCGFRDPGDTLLFRPGLVRPGEAVVYAVGSDIEFRTVGRNASAEGLLATTTALAEAGKVRVLAS